MTAPESRQLSTAFGQYRLNRYPLRKKELLQAWDAADEYLLNHLAEEGIVTPGSKILVVNDGFGAVTVSLAKMQPAMQTDSFIAQWSTEENLRSNGIEPESISLLPSTVDLGDQRYDLVLVRVPKTLALLEHQLSTIKRHLTENGKIIGYGMVKQISRSTLDLFSAIIGETRTSLAKKKARLIFASPDITLADKGSSYPIWYSLEGYGFQVCSHANVFSRERLDIGTRLLLQHLPERHDFQDIVDLGCGSGALGLVAGSRNPQSRIFFIDESYMAVASAEATFRASGLGNESVFIAGDGLEGFARQSVDLVLCNPPFHQQHVVGDFIAWGMFQQSHKALRRGGELRIVGNRHLNYHIKLKRIFGNAEVIASDRKFVIIRAVKQ